MGGGAVIVTPLYAALLAFWFMVLTLRVSQRRHSEGVSLGDGGRAPLQRAIRAHANFAEYVPFALVLLLLLELTRVSIYVVHALGITLVVARVLHGIALAFTDGWRFGRFWGTLLTVVVIVIAAALALYRAYVGHAVWFAA
jgi:uncharacterized membrane protein YecN with MAPEG domain